MDNDAVEVVYHRSCYQEFTNKYILKCLKHTLVEKEFPYTAAFKALFLQVEHMLLEVEHMMTSLAPRN